MCARTVLLFQHSDVAVLAAVGVLTQAAPLGPSRVSFTYMSAGAVDYLWTEVQSWWMDG